MTRFILAICFGAGDLTGQFITYAVAGRVVVKIGVRVMLGRVCDPNAFPGYPYEIAEWLRSVVDRAMLDSDSRRASDSGRHWVSSDSGRHWVSALGIALSCCSDSRTLEHFSGLGISESRAGSDNPRISHRPDTGICSAGRGDSPEQCLPEQDPPLQGQLRQGLVELPVHDQQACGETRSTRRTELQSEPAGPEAGGRPRPPEPWTRSLEAQPKST